MRKKRSLNDSGNTRAIIDVSYSVTDESIDLAKLQTDITEKVSKSVENAINSSALITKKIDKITSTVEKSTDFLKGFLQSETIVYFYKLLFILFIYLYILATTSTRKTTTSSVLKLTSTILLYVFIGIF